MRECFLVGKKVLDEKGRCKRNVCTAHSQLRPCQPFRLCGCVMTGEAGAMLYPESKADFFIAVKPYP